MKKVHSALSSAKASWKSGVRNLELLGDVPGNYHKLSTKNRIIGNMLEKSIKMKNSGERVF